MFGSRSLFDWLTVYIGWTRIYIDQRREILFNDGTAMLYGLEQTIDILTKNDFEYCFDDWFIPIGKCFEVRREYFEYLHRVL